MKGVSKEGGASPGSCFVGVFVDAFVGCLVWLGVCWCFLFVGCLVCAVLGRGVRPPPPHTNTDTQTKLIETPHTTHREPDAAGEGGGGQRMESVLHRPGRRLLLLCMCVCVGGWMDVCVGVSSVAFLVHPHIKRETHTYTYTYVHV